jgi:DNA-binding XRE family transcriptional regulator
MNQSTLSKVLINARQSLRLAQTEVADYVDASQSTYNNWESGKHTPSMKYIPKLCQILKLEINDILPPPRNLLIIS